MKKVGGEMTALASAEATRRAVREFAAVRGPCLTLLWRGRTRVRLLEGGVTTEVKPLGDGLVNVYCRCRLKGPVARLLGAGLCEQVREDLRELAAAICARAEALQASSSDGRPPPEGEPWPAGDDAPTDGAGPLSRPRPAHLRSP